ncbi:SYF2-domain-containing protein [Phellopilus nigrolimitatus]|nr:SYF2-domain-containing protein [Phellopilus nigrolimitatus]
MKAATGKLADSAKEVVEGAAEFVEEMTDTVESDAEQARMDVDKEGSEALTMEERKKKLSQLRNRMRDSARQNRTELINESTKLKTSVREAARREKQVRLAETLRLKSEAEEHGEDLDRKKNWEYTIEENDEWEKKKRRKERNADFEFHDEEQQARKRYKKDLIHLKPDLAAYNKQKELATGLAPGALIAGSSSTSALTAFNPRAELYVASYEQQRAAESLYRDANTLLYADSKPTDDAIDRVIGKLNMEYEPILSLVSGMVLTLLCSQDRKNKFSRKRLNEDEGDVTYINERNRVFNKKIARYYDKYTSEIRASFERGTAL